MEEVADQKRANKNIQNQEEMLHGEILEMPETMTVTKLIIVRLYYTHVLMSTLRLELTSV